MTVGIPPSVPSMPSGASSYDGTSTRGSRSSRGSRGASASDGGDVRSETRNATRKESRVWRDRPRWQRLLAYLLLSAAALVVVTGAWWAPRVLSRLSFFNVSTVDFEGVRFAATDELLDRLHVDTTQSVWQPLDSLAARLADHPLVARVDVERDLPGTLRVLITERTPVALVQTRGGLRPADATGARLPIDPARVPLDMPIVLSADSALLAVLDGLRENAPTLYERVTQAARERSGDLRFVLTGGVVGAAGPSMNNTLIVRTEPDVTVARFRDILPVEADLARNHLRAVELDLRFRDQVIARQP